MKRQWIVAGCTAALCSGAVWAFDFSAPMGTTVNGTGAAIAVGDINGDQLDDVVVATTNTGASTPVDDDTALLYLQQADGTLAAPLKYRFSTEVGNVDVALGDFNQDGASDVVACSLSGLEILSKQADTFATSTLPGRCSALAVLDVDRDGHLDIVEQLMEGNATVYYGAGTGAFPRHSTLATGGDANAKLLPGDVNGDGRPDLVVIDFTESLQIFLHDSATGFQAPLVYGNPDMGGGIAGGVIADLNRDGRQDLVITQAASYPNAALWLYTQGSDGTLPLDPVHIDSSDVPTTPVAADIDRDGRTDLLVGHAGQNTIGRYMQGAAGLAPEITTAVPYASDWSRTLAVGDVNDDGCTDAVAVGPADTLQVLLGKRCVHVRPTHDINGDGRSDVVWRNATTGANAIWLGGDAATTRAVATVTSLAWRLVGVGDFAGDGKADLLWRRESDGTNTVWPDGDASRAYRLYPLYGTGWAAVAVTDFNGDRRDDILWHDGTYGFSQIWLSADSLNQQAVTSITDTRWVIAGAGDFDGDHCADILWRHLDTGANTIWWRGNSAKIRRLAVAKPTWRVGGIGDFDGDGKADIFWRNSTGSNSVWRSGDVATPMAIASRSAAWTAVVGDYTGDRKADLLWRNTTTGEDVMWRAGQASVPRDITDVTTTSWQMVP